MSNRELDPPESQVRILFGRHAGQCSYPECGIQLVVPGRVRGDRPKNVAKIAHITAASPDGPRYDLALTPDERRSEPNLMLLCGTHHDAVDAQLVFHTTEWLKKAKKDHIQLLDRGKRYSMGRVGYKELDLVCQVLSLQASSPNTEGIESIDLSLDIDEKIRLNALGEEARALIELGLAQDQEVRRFLKQFDNMIPGFTRGLTARFKVTYYEGVAEQLSPDERFNAVLGAAYENCGPQLSNSVAAAALAVVAHLFSICEIFEHEPAAAG